MNPEDLIHICNNLPSTLSDISLFQSFLSEKKEKIKDKETEDTITLGTYIVNYNSY